MVQTKFHVLIFIAVAMIASLLYFSCDPAFSNLFPPCPFYLITQLYCPGCGSQRALHDILHGDLIGAADHNLLFTLFLPVVGFSGLVVSNNIFRRKKISQKVFYSSSFALAVLITVLCFWVMRNLPYDIFQWMAP